MNRFFKDSSKLSRSQLSEVAALLGGVALLLVMAGFVASGGMRQVNHLLAVAHILPEAQTACVFPCNNSAYDMEALTPMQGGVAVSTVQPGTTVYWQYIASSYGANNFTTLCGGSSGGIYAACSVAQGATNVWGSCAAPYWTGGTTCIGGYTASCDKFGSCSYTCNYYDTPVYHPGTGCGNADAAIQGDTCYGASGGIYPNYSCPGYHGNPYGTLPITAPSAAGTYTYYFCSYYLENANAFNGSLTPLPCLGTNITVASPPPTCSLTSASVYYGQPANLSYSTANATGVTYAIDGVAQGAPAGNPFNTNPSGTLAVGNHNVTMTVTGPGGSATCGGANYVVINTPPAPSCTLSPATQFIGNGTSATFTYTVSNQGWATPTYKIDGGAPITPAGTTFSVSGLAPGTHSVIMTAVNSVGATATCGTANDVSVGNAAPPVVSVSANPTTVNPNATSTITWTSSGATPGMCTLTAPSSSGVATNFGSFSSSAAANSWYGTSFTVSGGYVWWLGGYNGSAWQDGIWKVPVGADLTIPGGYTAMGSLPAAAGMIDMPVTVGSNVYLIGGYSVGSGYTYSICTAPISNLSGTGWSCPASLPAGAGQAYTDTVQVGDYLYRFGGYNSVAGLAVNSVARAPISSPTTWTNFTNVLPMAGYDGASLVVGNYVYLIVGANNSGVTNVIYRAPITSDLTQSSSWTSGGTLAFAHDGMRFAVDSTYVYDIGGYNGASQSSIYRATLTSLAAGAPSWTLAGTFPGSVGLLQPSIMMEENKLYIFGGYSSVGPTYINKIYSVPFNDGQAYTTTAELPWLTDGGNNSAATWPITANSTTYTLQCINNSSFSTKKIFLTTVGSGTWTVPSDWNSANNKIEVIGGGGEGAVGYQCGGGAGGGGGYSSVSNMTLTPGASVSYYVGAGGNSGGYGAAGASTWFNSVTPVAASGGAGGVNDIPASACAVHAGGVGGQASAGTGTTKYSGGNGGSSAYGGGGGGGAAGPNGAGKNGGSYGGGNYSGGAGGGGSDGGSSTAGANTADPQISGNGGNGTSGFGAGVGNCVAGTLGGGGSGGYAASCGGASGGMDNAFDSTHGSGGGGGGGGAGSIWSAQSTGRPGGPGSIYGGGGGGGDTVNAVGGAGAQGIIVITYTPAAGQNITSTASATITEPDLCTNAPFTGIQNPLPANTTAVGTTCTCTTGLWNGSSCFVSPVIGTPTISPLIVGSITAVKRVKKGNSVTLNWSVTGLVANDTNSTCSVYSFPAAAMTPQTWDGTTATWTQPATPPTVTINGPTTFTVSCSNATWATPTISASSRVDLVPTFQEQ